MTGAQEKLGLGQHVCHVEMMDVPEAVKINTILASEVVTTRKKQSALELVYARLIGHAWGICKELPHNRRIIDVSTF